MTKTRQILCIDPEPSELRIAALLNRRGIPASLTEATVPNAIQEALSRCAWWDLILCDAAAYRELEASNSHAELMKDADASLILLQTREGGALTPAAAHRLGAADIVQRGDMDHLLMVCERELQNCATRKELRQVREQGASGTVAKAPLMLATINDMGKMNKPEPPKPAAAAASHRQIEADTQGQDRIKALIDAGGLTLEFQPIISFQPQEEHRGMFEALVRLKDDDGKVLPPSEFLPIAERAGWMGKIDLWIFRRVLATLEQMQQGGHPDAVLFVNVATSTLASERLVDALGAFATTANLSPGSLVVEVRKAAFVEAAAGLERLIERLRAKHHGLLVEGAQLEDCAVLAQHRDLITHIKLDRTVAEGLVEGRIPQSRLGEFVQCARREGVRIIALAVESAELLSLLFASGVDAIQGHFVSQPYSDLVYPSVQQVEASSAVRWSNRNH